MILIDRNNFIKYEEAPWDGAPLAMSAYNITEYKTDSETNADILINTFDNAFKDIEYSSVRVDSRDVLQLKALGKAGFHMTEIAMKVTGVLSKLDIDNTLFDKFTFEKASVKDYDTIARYAVRYFNHGKFHEDPLISRTSADTRNINMVRDLTDKYETFVGRVGDKVIGFMILNQDNSTVELLLGGMHIDYRHLSYAFWNRVFSEYKNKAVKKFITTISAANIPVINLYSRFGFKFSQALYGFRKFRLHANTNS